jgi:membrane protease YdiL (CAAX protease family)
VLVFCPSVAASAPQQRHLLFQRSFDQRLDQVQLALARAAPETLIVAGHFPPEIRWRQFVQSV